MAKVLSEGDFAKEALAPMSEAVETALHALTHWQGHDTETAPDPGLIESALVQSKMLPAETLTLVASLRENHAIGDEAQAAKLLARCDSLLSRAAAVLESTQGS